MVVVGPGVLMGTGVRESFVIGRGSGGGPVSRSPERSRLPFGVNRGANPGEEAGGGIEDADATYRRIVGRQACNSTANAASQDTGINRTGFECVTAA